MANYIVSDTNLTAVANAIRQKGGTSASLEFPDGFVSAIGDIQTGGGGGSGTGDVRFLDYDGTVVQAYSASEFASLESLPSNPTHSGLTAQGWNWSLADAKSHVASYGQLDIGQMYVTDDGKTRIYVSLTEGTLNPTLGLGVNGSVDIDWGDGTAHSTLTGTSISTLADADHVYASAGEYVISLTVTGSARIYGTNSITHIFKNKKNSTQEGNYKYLNAIHSVRLGANINLDAKAFMFCYSLASISIPNTVTSIGTNAFYYCYSLASISIPNTVTSIGTSAFSACHGLASISIPNTVTSIGTYAFQNCYSLVSISLPNTVTSIETNAFYYCYSLASISIPNTVTSIGTSAFGACYSLASISIPNTVTSIGTYAFQGCCSLVSISIPNTVTSIGTYAFQNCYSLASISLPNTLTSIGANAFYYCYSLASVSLPNTLTSIVKSAFNSCYGLETVVVPASTATLGANAFGSCQSLEEVTFLGTPTTMPATVFSSCTKLTTINVPWSEGDVANAPWGATNATINYDYTG